MWRIKAVARYSRSPNLPASLVGDKETGLLPGFAAIWPSSSIVLEACGSQLGEHQLLRTQPESCQIVFYSSQKVQRVNSVAGNHAPYLSADAARLKVHDPPVRPRNLRGAGALLRI